MEEQNFEDFAKRWPDLFQKSGDFEFSIGPGWYGIIDTLCGLMSQRVEQAKARLKYAMENPDRKLFKSIPELEQEVADALEELPEIAQVKEKFGTLRFYINGGTVETHNYIAFAEAMTAHVCEVCGSPGKSRHGNWVRVLCNQHHMEQCPEEYPDEPSTTKLQPGLAED